MHIVSINIHQYSSAFINMHSYSPIFINIQQYSSIFTSIHQYALIYTNIHQYSTIFTNIHQYYLIVARGATCNSLLAGALKIHMLNVLPQICDSSLRYIVPFEMNMLNKRGQKGRWQGRGVRPKRSKSELPIAMSVKKTPNRASPPC